MFYSLNLYLILKDIHNIFNNIRASIIIFVKHNIFTPKYIFLNKIANPIYILFILFYLFIYAKLLDLILIEGPSEK